MSQEFFQFGFDEPHLKDDDFIVSECNRTAFDMINKWPSLWEGNIFLIYGPAHCGKTHLGRIWQNRAKATYLKPADIYAGKYNVNANYIIDDIESVHDEAAFFHFFNNMKEKGQGYLLLTASAHPQHSAIRLADLRSRLSSVPSAGVSQPDDILMGTIFAKHFADRQLKVEKDVINYLITRTERSFGAVAQMVENLDKQALKQRKNITKPFVRSVLETELYPEND